MACQQLTADQPIFAPEVCQLDSKASALLASDWQANGPAEQPGLRARAHEALPSFLQHALDDMAGLAADIGETAVGALMVTGYGLPMRIAAVSAAHWRLSLDPALCLAGDHAGETVVISDMRRDPRLAEHPLVRSENGLRFQAAVPVRSADGLLLGWLHLFDAELRPGGLGERQIQLLDQVARQAAHWLTLAVSALASDRADNDDGGTHRFRAIFDQAAVGLARVAGDGRLVEVNDRFCAIAGRTRDELTQNNWLRATRPDDLATGFGLLTNMLDAGTSCQRAEKRHVRPDGTAIWIAFTCSMAQAADGAADGFIVAAEDITERKTAEMQRERLAQIVEHSPDFIGFTDTDGRVTFINRAGRRMIGLDESADIAGLHFKDYVADESQPLFRATVLPTVRRGDVWEGEMRLRHLRTGEPIDVRRSAFALRDVNGRIAGFGTVTRDLTAANRMEARISLALAAGHMGIWEWDIVADRIHWSDETYAIFGQDRARFQPTLAGFEALVYPPDKDRFRADMKAVLAGGAEYEIEARFVRGDGAVRWMHGRGQIRRNADGQPVSVLGTVADVTERRETERALRDSEELNRRILSASPDCIKLVSLDGRLEYFSEGGLCAMEVDDFNAQLKGKDWAACWPAESQAMVQSAITSAIAGGTSRFQAFCPTAKGTPKWWDVSVTAISGADGRPERLLSVSRDITELHRVEQQLRQREAELAHVQRIVQVGGYEVDLRGGFFNRRSPEYLTIHGLPPDAWNERHEAWVDRIHPDDRAQAETGFIAAVNNGAKEYAAEYRIIRPSDGAIRWVSVFAAIEHDANGLPLRLIGAHLDITERKRIEVALRANARELRDLNQTLQLALNSAYAIAFTWDIETDRVTRLFSAEPGLPATDADTLDGVMRAVHPDDRDLFRANIDRACAHPAGDYHNEFRLVRPDGTVRWLEERGKIERDARGQPLRLIGISMDFTERKEAEAALKASREQLAVQLEELNGLYAEAPLGLALLDRELRFVRINPALAAINGLPVEAHIGHRVWELVPELRQSAEPALRRVLETGEPLRDVAVSGSTPAEPGITRHWNEQFYPLRDSTGAIIGIGIVCEEVTERMRAVAALEQSREQYRVLNEKLEERVAERTAALQKANARLADEVRRREATQAALVQAQKLEALGQLTSGIAHDFNNIVAAISGGFSVIERRTSDPRLIEVSRHGVKAAERGAALVKQLLAFARQQVLQPVTVRLTHLFTEAEPLLRRSVGAAVDLKIDCPADLWPVRADPVQLETALINLAVNARDAMPDGGTLVMEARACPVGASDHPSELGFRDAVSIRVIDTGCGMPPDILRHVVEPFFTTKGPGKGTGLGLPMVHGFAHQSGGTLNIESAVGQGTIVTLFLPRADALDEEAFSAETIRDIPRHHGGATILLVDDDEQVRAVTAAQLSDLGYGIIEAGSGQDALDRLDAHVSVDAVLSDVVMPGMDGPAMAAAIAARNPALPILFMTGRADLSKLAGQAVIEKPFTPSELAHAVLELLGRERGGSRQE